jgi:hypothetical protein
MERHELLERLVPLIPPPRAHQVRHHGVLGHPARVPAIAPCSDLGPLWQPPTSKTRSPRSTTIRPICARGIWGNSATPSVTLLPGSPTLHPRLPVLWMQALGPRILHGIGEEGGGPI